MTVTLDEELQEQVEKLKELIQERGARTENPTRHQRNFWVGPITDAKIEALRAVHGSYSEVEAHAIDELYEKDIVDMARIADQLQDVRDRLNRVVGDQNIVVRFMHEPTQTLADLPAWTILKFAPSNADVIRKALEEFGLTAYMASDNHETLNTIEILEHEGIGGE